MRLLNDEFMPYFQPLMRLADSAVVGYEALLRWQHPQRGVLAPGEFLQVAEDSGLIEAIDWRMFRLALNAAANWCAMAATSPSTFRRACSNRKTSTGNCSSWPWKSDSIPHAYAWK